MSEELDVLILVADRLDAARIPYMDVALNIRNAEAERLHDEAAPRQAPR